MNESERSTYKMIGVVILVIAGMWLLSEVFGGNSGRDVSEVGGPVPSSTVVAEDCAKYGKFCGDLMTTYQSAYDGCSAFGRAELRRQLGASSSNAADIGEAFASAYESSAYQAAFEGCVDGVLARG